MTGLESGRHRTGKLGTQSEKRYIDWPIGVGTKYADLTAHGKHLQQRGLSMPPEKGGVVLGMSASPSCRFASVLDMRPTTEWSLAETEACAISL